MNKFVKLRYQAPVMVLTGVITSVLIIFAAWHMVAHYRAAKQDGIDRQLIYVTALAEHAERSIGEALLTLDRVVDEIRFNGGLQRIHEKKLYDLFVDYTQRAPQIGSVLAVNSSGQLIAVSLEYPVRKISVTDRDYFIYHRDNLSLQPYFSHPYKNRIDGTWRFGVSRRVNNPDGSFAGLVSVSIKINYFQNIYKAFNPLPTERVSLIRLDDGFIQAGVPVSDATFKVNLKKSALFTRYLPKNENGNFVGILYDSDKIDRLVSYDKLNNAPLAASISIEPSVILTEWKNHAIQLGIVTLFSIVVIIWFATRLTKQMNQYHQQLEATVHERTEELQQTMSALERSNKELEQFAYVASHDLQEPLRMVASFTQLLQQQYKGKLDAEADEYIHYAVDGANRMQILIQDLLSYSRVTTKGRPFEAVDLNGTMGLVRSNLQLQIEDSHVLILNDDLPTVQADPTQMLQLLQNLVSNAIKFRGELVPQVRITAADAGDFWQIRINDNGIGIEPQYFARIFQIFQRLHNRDAYPGTGIGLAVCKRIVERHGGQISVESEPGKGTTFMVTLPKAY